MGSLRSIKTEVRDEERAAEGLKRENQDRQWEEEYESWQQSHDANYSEHNGEKRPCFGSHYCIQEPISPQCRHCNAQDSCYREHFDYLVYCSSISFVPITVDDLEEEYDYEQDLLWEQDYDFWIKEQSREE